MPGRLHFHGLGCMAAQLVTSQVLAKEFGVSRQAVEKAAKAGRLTVFDGGLFDIAVARVQWDANRRRRRARPGAKRPDAVEQTAADGAGGSVSGEGSDYWTSKTRRETAEAAIAELKLAELAGTLVLRDEVNRTLFVAARVMRDQMLAIAPRLAASLGPVTDPKLIELRIADEVRVALRAFAQQLRAGGLPDVDEGDGQPG